MEPLTKEHRAVIETFRHVSSHMVTGGDAYEAWREGMRSIVREVGPDPETVRNNLADIDREFSRRVALDMARRSPETAGHILTLAMLTVGQMNDR